MTDKVKKRPVGRPAENVPVGTLGSILRSRRLELTMTQEDLAEKTGIRPSQLSLYERNGGPVMRVKTLRKICKALKLDWKPLIEMRERDG